MKVAACYIRVSTEEQIEFSPESQLKRIRDYAKQNGYILPQEYIFMDEGISGKNTQKRPEFNKMIGVAKSKPKPFDAILLWKFSRFARNREDSIVYKSMLRKQLGIDVISISENIGDDKTSVIFEAMIEAMDEYYSINLGEEVKRGMLEKVSRGEAVSQAPFGYKIVDKQLIPDEETAPVVKKIFEKYCNGGYLKVIAKEISDEGYRTIRGNRFDNRNIEYIIRNPVYIGKIRWCSDGEIKRHYDNPNIMVVDGKHQAIISEKLFQAAQNRLAEQKNKYKRGQHKEPANYMLKGLVRCHSCGSVLSLSTNNSKYKYLQCLKYCHGKCTVSHHVVLATLNNIVLNTIEISFKTQTFNLVQRKKVSSIADSTSNIKKQIEKETRKLQRVKEAYEDEVYTLAEYKESKRNIEQTIKQLQDKLIAQPQSIDKARFVAEHMSTLEQLKDEKVPENEKNELLRSFVDKILYNKFSKSVELFFYC